MSHGAFSSMGAHLIANRPTYTKSCYVDGLTFIISAAPDKTGCVDKDCTYISASIELPFGQRSEYYKYTRDDETDNIITAIKNGEISLRFVEYSPYYVSNLDVWITPENYKLEMTYENVSAKGKTKASLVLSPLYDRNTKNIEEYRKYLQTLEEIRTLRAKKMIF